MLTRKKIIGFVTVIVITLALLHDGKVSAATAGCNKQCACSSLAVGTFRAVYNTTGDATLASSAGVAQYYACMWY